MSRNFLSEIVARKRQAVERLRASSAADALHAQALEVRKNAAPHRLRQALETASPELKIIAEFKRVSPSVGMIRSDLSPADVAHHYERGGACAISVLTDKEYFGGSIDDLSAVRSSTHLPVLRKDFIIDEIQIYEASIAGADAILLIVAALDNNSLGGLREVAEDELGLDALIEVHTSEELRRALNAGAKIIGVNNRDLQTFEVSLSTSERLISESPADCMMISESGLRSPEQLCDLQALGFHGFLIGEQLMRAKNPEAALRNMLTDVKDPQITSHAWDIVKMDQVQIKICGITSLEDARVCAELGADMIGLNFYPQSLRYIEPQRAREIVEVLPGSIRAVGVFVDPTAGEVRNVANVVGIKCAQLHGDASQETCRELARRFRVIRAFSTDGQFQPEDVGSFGDCAVLLDAHHPELRGGTGLTCDWPAARATLPFARFLILSGGLNAQNVGQAIATVAPHAVDVCSGVENTPGVKDYRAIEKFIAAARTAQRFIVDRRA